MNVSQIFAQMAEAFQSEKAGDLCATFQFELSGEDGGDWVITVADQACTVVEGKVDKADVAIAMAAGDFVQMVEGDLQPVVAFMQGKIRLQGDMNLAMKLQELFAFGGD